MIVSMIAMNMVQAPIVDEIEMRPMLDFRMFFALVIMHVVIGCDQTRQVVTFWIA